MRLMCVFLAIATLAACSANQTERPTTSRAPITTTTEAKSTTTTTPATTTTESEEDNGMESIGITDTVTIVITDPGND